MCVRCLSPLHIYMLREHPNTRRSSVRQKSWANEQRVVADAGLAYAGMLQLRYCSCWTRSAAFSKRSSRESPARAPAAPRPCNCSDRVRLSHAVRRPRQGLRGRCRSNNHDAERGKENNHATVSAVYGDIVPFISRAECFSWSLSRLKSTIRRYI